MKLNYSGDQKVFIEKAKKEAISCYNRTFFNAEPKDNTKEVNIIHSHLYDFKNRWCPQGDKLNSIAVLSGIEFIVFTEIKEIEVSFKTTFTQYDNTEKCESNTTIVDI